MSCAPMWLLDKLLRKLFHKGELTVIDHDGKTYRCGTPDPGISAGRRNRREPVMLDEQGREAD